MAFQLTNEQFSNSNNTIHLLPLKNAIDLYFPRPNNPLLPMKNPLFRQGKRYNQMKNAVSHSLKSQIHVKKWFFRVSKSIFCLKK